MAEKSDRPGHGQQNGDEQHECRDRGREMAVEASAEPSIVAQRPFAGERTQNEDGDQGWATKARLKTPSRTTWVETALPEPTMAAITAK